MNEEEVDQLHSDLGEVVAKINTAHMKLTSDLEAARGNAQAQADAIRDELTALKANGVDTYALEYALEGLERDIQEREFTSAIYRAGEIEMKLYGFAPGYPQAPLVNGGLPVLKHPPGAPS